MFTAEELSKEVIKLGGSVVDYFVDNTGLTSKRIKELYNSNESNEFRDVVYFIYKRKQLPSESYELVCDFIQDGLREAHATIPHNDIPMDIDDEVFDIVYEDCLKKLVAWATKEVKACDGNRLLKPKLLETNEEITKNIEDDEINIEEFDAKVIGDMAIAKADDIVSYFIKRTGLTHEVIQGSFYKTKERAEYKRIYNIRNFDDSDREMQEVVQRWIRGIMNNIVFNSEAVPEEAKNEIIEYLRDYATTKISEWVEDEYSQCVEPEIDEDINNINVSVFDSESNIEPEIPEDGDIPEYTYTKVPEETEKEEGVIDKITSAITNKFVEKSVSNIKNIPFVYESETGAKVFINPKNVILVEEIVVSENDTDEFSRIHLDNGKIVVINCPFYTFMENYSDYMFKKKK